MTAETRARIKKAFFEVSDAPPSERERLLSEICGEDEDARMHVAKLLDAGSKHAGVDGEKSFLETPALSREALEKTAPSHAQSLDLVGEVANGEYRLIRKVGEGGMGTVYEAEQRSPNRRVAIKFLRSGVTSAELLRRFQHEAEILGRLDHPGIARVHQAGSTAITYADGSGGHAPYFAMEFIAGEPITAFAEHLSLPIRSRLELLADLCEAVEHAHQKGVIHRDLKPGNVLVAPDPEATSTSKGRVKVLDFGVARITEAWDRANASMHTSGIGIVGTLAYMSPEQLAGGADRVDTRSDVYALGVIGHELLSGKLPIDVRGLPLSQAERLIAEREPPKLGTLTPELRGDVETIILKALEKEQSNRYSSAAELAADIRRFLRDEPIIARPLTASMLTRRFVRRNQVPIAATCAAILLVIGGLSYGLLEARKERDKARLAEIEAKNQTRITQAVNAFINEDVLAAVDPSSTPNPDIRMRDVLDAAGKKIEGRFPDDPLVEAGVRMTIGSTYMSLADHDNAALHLKRALDLRRANLPRGHADTVLTLTRLAEVRYRAGDLAAAAEAFAQTVEEGKLAPIQTTESEELLRHTTGNLGFILMKLGRHAEAEPLLIEHIRMQKAAGPDSPELVPALQNLAMLYMEQRRTDQAEPLLMEAIQAGKARLGPEHPITLLATQNLAAAYNIAKRFSDAIPLLQETLETQSRVLGEEHPQTLNTKANLGFSYMEAGDLARAEPLLESTFERRVALLGAGHHHTLTSRFNFGGLRNMQGRHEEAERLYLEGEKLSRGPDGKAGTITARFVRALAEHYDKRGDAKAAEEWRGRMP